jgi:hypothetical protein
MFRNLLENVYRRRCDCQGGYPEDCRRNELKEEFGCLSDFRLICLSSARSWQTTGRFAQVKLLILLNETGYIWDRWTRRREIGNYQTEGPKLQQVLKELDGRGVAAHKKARRRKGTRSY